MIFWVKQRPLLAAVLMASVLLYDLPREVSLAAAASALSALIFGGLALGPIAGSRTFLNEMRRLFANAPLKTATVAGLFAALVEEPLFRLAIQDRFGLVAALFAFWALHLRPGFPIASLTAAVPATILALSYELADDFWANAIAHGVFDFGAALSIGTFLRRQDPHERDSAKM